MKIRNIVAMLLAVLLVCSSGLASACELSCQMKQAMPVCHKAAESTDMVMDAAGHCSHMGHADMGHADIVHGDLAGVSVCSSCGAMSHGLAAPFFSPTQDASSLTDGHQATFVAAVVVVAPLRIVGYLRMEAPSGGSAGYRPLLVSLRV